MEKKAAKKSTIGTQIKPKYGAFPHKENDSPVSPADKPSPLHPSLTLLVKLGSAIVHAEEFLSPNGHEVDKIALDTLLHDAEVVQWIKDMKAFLPVKR